MARDPSSIMDKAFWRRPLTERMSAFAEWREHSPLLRVRLDAPALAHGVELTAVIGHREVSTVSRRHQDFSGQGGTSIVDLPGDILEYFSSILAIDGARHARQRRIVSPELSSRRVAAISELIEAACTEVLDGICEQGEADLVGSVAEPFALLVVCDLFGLPRSELPTIRRHAAVIVEAAEAGATGSTDRFGELIAAGAELTWLCGDVISHSQEHPGNDLTSALVHAGDGADRLTPEQLAALFVLAVTAGSYAPRAAITHGLHLLAQHPDQKADWQADPVGLTPTAVEEIVRLTSPVVYMRRTATRDTTLSGVHVEQGEKLVMFYGAANRDPAVFADPESMDLRRSPNPHVAFGAPGARSCLGAHLARAEPSVMFRQLLTRFPDIEPLREPELPETRSVPPFELVAHLRVRFTPSPPRGETSSTTSPSPAT